MSSNTALVVSAHSADFGRRAGGAIVPHAKAGLAVTVICLSFGERGVDIYGMRDRLKAKGLKHV